MFSSKLPSFNTDHISSRLRGAFRPRRNRTYIIPSKQGAKFVVLLTMLLLIGLVYNNNLVLGLSFFLASWFIIVMNLSHENIRSVKIESARLVSAFAGQDAEVEIVLSSGRWIDHRYDIEISGVGFTKVVEFESNKDFVLKITSHQLGLSRGIHEKIRLRLRSNFPFGMFQPWKTFTITEPWIVAPSRRLSDAVSSLMHEDDNREFTNHSVELEKKPGQVVDWKLTTMRPEGDQKIVVRNFHPPTMPELVFSWFDFAGDTEEKLSILSGLVYQAYQRDLLFKLKLPQWESNLESNATHYHRCIYELASFKA